MSSQEAQFNPLGYSNPETCSGLDPYYDDLLGHAKALGADVPYSDYSATMNLLETLRQFDEKTARESLQALPLAFSAADVLIDFYGNPQVDKSLIWSATILHDIGKAALPSWLIEKSNLGVEWTDEDRNIMKEHPMIGARIANDAGLPTQVSRTIAEHHHKQYGCQSYGQNPELNDLERTTRDCIAVADFTDAALNRTNSRNRHMSQEDRLQEVLADIRLVFDDYYRPDELAFRMFDHLIKQA